MKRHRWELLPKHARTWRCVNDGCAAMKREVTTPDGKRVQYTEYWADGQRTTNSAPPCPLRKVGQPK